MKPALAVWLLVFGSSALVQHCAAQQHCAEQNCPSQCSAPRCSSTQCCARCGCSSGCEQYCRVITEVKKVPKAVYDYECEDFCVPGPSQRHTECDECGHKRHVYTPGCGTVRTRKKLVKREIEEDKVSYKWVVETLCCHCAGCCQCVQRSAASPEILAAADKQSEVTAAQYTAALASPPTSAAPSQTAPASDDQTEPVQNLSVQAGPRKADLRSLLRLPTWRR